VITRDEILQLSTGEPEWLTDLRIQAWDQKPDRDDLHSDPAATLIEPFLTDASPEVAGVPSIDLPEEVVYCALEDAVRDHEALVRPYLYAASGISGSRTRGMNAALWKNGTFVHVPAGVSVGKALTSWSRFAGVGEGGFERLLIVLEEGASLSFVQGCASAASPVRPINSSVVEIILRDRATLNWVMIQNWDPLVLNSAEQHTLLYEDASLTSTQFDFGSTVTARTLACRLIGNRSALDLNLGAFAWGDQDVDLTVDVAHEGSGTRAQVRSDVIVSDMASIVVHDRVTGGHSGSSTDIEINALVCGDDATFRTDPDCFRARWHGCRWSMQSTCSDYSMSAFRTRRLRAEYQPQRKRNTNGHSGNP
jgi:Fe-S cluster assembly scaffold protein SufB